MGRPRTWLMREIMNAIFYVLRSGCGWRMIPKCFPPATTVYGWFLRFRREGILETIDHRTRECAGVCSRPAGQWRKAPADAGAGARSTVDGARGA